MSDELKKLKNKLRSAKSEEETLAALDGFSRQLTDDELMFVYGGSKHSEGKTEENSTSDPDQCNGPFSDACATRKCGYYFNFNINAGECGDHVYGCYLLGICYHY